MAKIAIPNQIPLEEREIESIVKEYLEGRISLDQAVTKVPKAKMGIFDYVLKVVLPEDLYLRRKVPV